MNTGKWLDDLLKEKGWTYAELANVTGLDSAVISNIKNGKRKAGPDTALKIAKALDLPPEYVFRLAGILPPKKNRNDEELEQIFHEFENMSADERREALAVIRALRKIFPKRK